MKKTIILLFLCAILILLMACNFPSASQTVLFPTANLTTTAIMAQMTVLTPDEQKSATPQADNAGAATQSPTASMTSAVTTATQSGQGVPTVAITPVNAYQRKGDMIQASFLNTPPIIDGNWDEWATTAYPAAYVTYGLSNWSGPDDLEGSFRIGWDYTYLYIAVKVRDDRYSQSATGSNIYQGDSIEILFDRDLAGDFTSTTLTGDDYQLGISPGNPDTNGTKEAYLWFPRSLMGSRTGTISIGATGGDGLYRVEVAIPWSVLGISPAKGQQYGFALSISDNDIPGATVQQSLVSNIVTRKLIDPTSWGQLLLTQ